MCHLAAVGRRRCTFRDGDSSGGLRAAVKYCIYIIEVHQSYLLLTMPVQSFLFPNFRPDVYLTSFKLPFLNKCLSHTRRVFSTSRPKKLIRARNMPNPPAAVLLSKDCRTKRAFNIKCKANTCRFLLGWLLFLLFVRIKGNV